MPDPVESAVQDMFRVQGEPAKARALEITPASTPEPSISAMVERDLAPFKEAGMDAPVGSREAAALRAIPKSPEVKAGVSAAALTGATMLAPELLGLTAASAPEFFTAMGLSAGGAVAGEAVRQHAKGLLGGYTEPVAMGIEALTPMSLQGTAARIAPRAAAETKTLAREAEREGFKIKPEQVSHTPTPTFNEKNAVVANRMVTKPTGMETEKLDSKFFENRRAYFKEEYDDIYSKANSFQIDPKDHADIVTAWNDLKAMGRVPPSMVKAIETKAPQIFSTQGGFTNGAELKDVLDELSAFSRKGMSNPLTHDAAQEAQTLFRKIRGSFTATDPKLASRLQDVNKKYGAFKILDEMGEADKLPNMNVDLQELDKRLRGLSAKYRTGQRNDPTARAGRIGNALNIRATPPPEKRDSLGRLIGAGVGGTGGALAATAVGGSPMEAALAAAFGAKAEDMLARGTGRLVDTVTDPVGRFIQRLSSPQFDELERLGLLPQLLGQARPAAGAVAAGQLRGDDNAP